MHCTCCCYWCIWSWSFPRSVGWAQSFWAWVRPWWATQLGCTTTWQCFIGLSCTNHPRLIGRFMGFMPRVSSWFVCLLTLRGERRLTWKRVVKRVRRTSSWRNDPNAISPKKHFEENAIRLVLSSAFFPLNMSEFQVVSFASISCYQEGMENTTTMSGGQCNATGQATMVLHQSIKSRIEESRNCIKFHIILAFVLQIRMKLVILHFNLSIVTILHMGRRETVDSFFYLPTVLVWPVGGAWIFCIWHHVFPFDNSLLPRLSSRVLVVASSFPLKIAVVSRWWEPQLRSMSGDSDVMLTFNPHLLTFKIAHFELFKISKFIAPRVERSLTKKIILH